MRMIKALLVLAIAGIAFTGCKKKGAFRKTKGGMPYTFYAGSGKVALKKDGYIKFHILQKLNDSVMFDSRKNAFPLYQQGGGISQPYDISELFAMDLKKGDSIVATQMLDTFIARQPQLAQQFKKGDKVTSYLKVIDVFNTMEEYKADETAEKDKFIAAEVKVVEDYVAKNKITAQKTGKGVYVQTLTAGSGPAIDSGKYISVGYTGTTFSGEKFDSNRDSTGKVMQPLSFVVGTGQMIKGFDDGVKGLSKGSKAVLYIPSMLAYGPQSPSPVVKPFTNLKFEVEILDIKDQAPPPPPMPSMRPPNPGGQGQGAQGNDPGQQK
jgi:FKBP-type peptidyl-prolyl cis-trans isomerase FkpA